MQLVTENLFDCGQDNYIRLLRTVIAGIKPHCTKGEIRFVTNRIISDFRRNKIFDKTINLFDVGVTPKYHIFPPGDTHYGSVYLNKGLYVYYGVVYESPQ